MLWVVVGVAWASDCTGPARETTLAAQLQAAELAYYAFDEDAFREASASIDALLPCLKLPISEPVAAQTHRVMALRAYAERNNGGAVRSFAGALSIDPDHQLSETLVPAGSTLRDLYDEGRGIEVGTVPLPRPRRVALYFDGIAASARPTGRATVAQVVERGGSARHTAYLYPGDPLPDYPTRGRVSVSGAALAGGGAAALVTAGVLRVAALAVQERFLTDTEVEGADELGQLRDRGNRLFAASAGVGAVGVAVTGAGLTLLTSRALQDR